MRSQIDLQRGRPTVVYHRWLQLHGFHKLYDTCFVTRKLVPLVSVGRQDLRMKRRKVRGFCHDLDVDSVGILAENVRRCCRTTTHNVSVSSFGVLSSSESFGSVSLSQAFWREECLHVVLGEHKTFFLDCHGARFLLHDSDPFHVAICF